MEKVSDSLDFTGELDEDEEEENDELEIMKPDFEAVADEEEWGNELQLDFEGVRKDICGGNVFEPNF